MSDARADHGAFIDFGADAASINRWLVHGVRRTLPLQPLQIERSSQDIIASVATVRASLAPAVVVHIPHASLEVPPDVAATFLLEPEVLEHELLVMTDRYTDELFALPSSLATTVTFRASRLVVDPERFTDDALEPMAQKGMGVVYTRTSTGRPLRRPPSLDERRHLLACFYEPHHAELTTVVEGALVAHDKCLVLDGHSFPTRALHFEYDQAPDRPDICIGTDKSHTPNWLRDVAVRAFEQAGWSVAVDRPYAGALVPMRFYQKDARVSAMMVEVKRGLYMDEQSGAKLPRFDQVRELVSRALKAVAAAWTSREGGR